MLIATRRNISSSSSEKFNLGYFSASMGGGSGRVRHRSPHLHGTCLLVVVRSELFRLIETGDKQAAQALLSGCQSFTERTISHTRWPSGRLRSLSADVLVNADQQKAPLVRTESVVL